MGGVNWWLMGIAFALGVALTLAHTLRRVTREVPVRDGGTDGGTEAGTDAPYGEGSVRTAAGAQPPTGWDVKGNEDSMLYHSTESPHYDRTVAEIWFRDVETAEAAGFRRWDSGASQRGGNAG